MDFSFFGGKYRDLSIQTALEECQCVADICRRFGGRLVILYHTGQSSPKVREFYRELLELVA